MRLIVSVFFFLFPTTLRANFFKPEVYTEGSHHPFLAGHNLLGHSINTQTRLYL